MTEDSMIKFNDVLSGLMKEDLEKKTSEKDEIVEENNLSNKERNNRIITWNINGYRVKASVYYDDGGYRLAISTDGDLKVIQHESHGVIISVS